jgi:chloramphenicol-sensitive protein RarD
MDNRKHYLAAVTAFLTWGFFAIPLRQLRDYGAGEILYFRIVCSAIILVIIGLFFKRSDWKEVKIHLQKLSKQQRNKTIFLTLLGGALLCVNWLIFIYIVNNVNIKTASFSYLICPVITTVLGYVIIKEKLTTIQWVAVSLCALSCMFIGIQSAYELLMSFVTAFTYALYLITQRMNQGVDRIVTLTVQILFSFILLTLCVPLLVHEVPTSTTFYSWIVLIAVLFTVMPLFLNLFALNKINSATIGILMYINPLINFTIAFTVFSEPVGEFQMIGYAIIVIALVIFNYPMIKRMQLKSAA